MAEDTDASVDTDASADTGAFVAADPFIDMSRTSDASLRLVQVKRSAIFDELNWAREEKSQYQRNHPQIVQVSVYNLNSDEEEEEELVYRRLGATSLTDHFTNLFVEEQGLTDVATVDEIGTRQAVTGDGHCLHRAFMLGLFDYAESPFYLAGQGVEDDGVNERLAFFLHLTDNFMSSWRRRMRQHLEDNQKLFCSNNVRVRDVALSDLSRCHLIETYRNRRNRQVTDRFLDQIWNADTDFNRPVGQNLWNGNCVLIVLCHFWRRTVVQYSSAPGVDKNCFIAYWCPKVLKVRIHWFGARWVTPPQGAICLHHDGFHYEHISIISRTPTLQSIYWVLLKNPVLKHSQDSQAVTTLQGNQDEDESPPLASLANVNEREGEDGVNPVLNQTQLSQAVTTLQGNEDESPPAASLTNENEREGEIVPHIPSIEEGSSWLLSLEDNVSLPINADLSMQDQEPEPFSEDYLKPLPLQEAAVPAEAEELLQFLRSKADYIKGSVDGFHDWLCLNDVKTMKDLKLALSDEIGFLTALRQGDGTNGLKSFTITSFVESVQKFKSWDGSQLKSPLTSPFEHQLKSPPEGEHKPQSQAQAHLKSQAQRKSPPEGERKPQSQAQLKPQSQAQLKFPPEGERKPQALSQAQLKPQSQAQLKFRPESQHQSPSEAKLKSQSDTARGSQLQDSTPSTKNMFSSDMLNKISSSPKMARYPMFSRSFSHIDGEEYYEFKSFDVDEDGPKEDVANYFFDVDYAELVGKIHTSQVDNDLTSVVFTENFKKDGPGKWFQDKLSLLDAPNLRHVSLRSGTASTCLVPSQTAGKKGKRPTQPFLAVWRGRCEGATERTAAARSKSDYFGCTTTYIGGLEYNELLKFSQSTPETRNRSIRFKVIFSGRCLHHSRKQYGNLSGFARKRKMNEVS